MVNEKMELYLQICKRAENFGYNGERHSLMMDLESADKYFNLRLEELRDADDYDFIHDVGGIINNIDRSTFPSKNFGMFVPRFAGSTE